MLRHASWAEDISMMELSDARGESGLMTFIDGTFNRMEGGHATMSVHLEQRHMNPGGVLHGGIVTTMIDEVTGRAIASIRGMEAMKAPHATIELNVTFLSTARPDDTIVCDAHALRVGRSVAFAEAEVRRRSDDALVAKGRATYAIPRRA